MVQFPRKLSRYTLVSLFSAICALAQTSTLSQIQDTVYTPASAPFNGTVVITWTGSTSSSGTAPFNTSVKIANGVLSVLLAPSTTVTPAAYYQAVYNSNDGLITWTEYWAVPPSTVPLTLSQIRVSGTTSSGGSGSTGGGSGGGSNGGGTSGTQIQISNVVGLSSDLNAINTSLSTFNSTVSGMSLLITNLTNTVTNLSNTVANLSSGATNAVFVDAETPNGTINGLNTVFTLANTPASAADLTLYRNGVLQANGVDYTVSGNAITFSASEALQTGDKLQAFYRIPGAGVTSNFVDAEIPSGTINGSNLTFMLANAPSPSVSLKLYKNGALLQENVDYTLANQTITFTNVAVTPVSGDSLCAYYRVTSQN